MWGPGPPDLELNAWSIALLYKNILAKSKGVKTGHNLAESS
jgi:hypothetical protein